MCTVCLKSSALYLSLPVFPEQFCPDKPTMASFKSLNSDVVSANIA